MYPREIASFIRELATFYPVIGITGPRQSGKTTLAKLLFPHLPYVSLENPDTRLEARQDPRAFLKKYPDGAIFDEIQHVPELLSYMQQIVDENRQPGRYVITGSQNFAISGSVAQSLAGRIGMVTLLPLSLFETDTETSAPEAIFKGGYPELYQKEIGSWTFYQSYIQTYIERDVRQLKNIADLDRFQAFVKLCAGRIGQLLNLSSLAQDAGISEPTAKAWISVLKASYILFTLQPYYKNFNKRLMKMPKLYFYDTGLACMLLGIEKATQVETHYLRGELFENLMILEVMKGRMNKGRPPNLYFWRDRTGHEIDLIGEWGGQIRAIEIKYGSTYQNSYIKNLQYFLRLTKPIAKEPVSAYLIYNGAQAGKHLDITLTPMYKVHEQILGDSDAVPSGDNS